MSSLYRDGNNFYRIYPWNILSKFLVVIKKRKRTFQITFYQRDVEPESSDVASFSSCI